MSNLKIVVGYGLLSVLSGIGVMAGIEAYEVIKDKVDDLKDKVSKKVTPPLIYQTHLQVSVCHYGFDCIELISTVLQTVLFYCTISEPRDAGSRSLVPEV